MITGELKSQVDKLWDAFWSGGISNPLEVIEQITYLLFIKRLDDLHTAAERRANRLKRAIERPIFNEQQQALRWSHFKNEAPAEMYNIVAARVFPFIRTLQSDREDSTYSHHMKDARFTIPKSLLARVVDMVDRIPMEDRDTKGDLYEYMLGKIAQSGQNGQFRTPRHIIRLMVEMIAPTPQDVICDPACGTAGFLVTAGEYLRERHPELLTNEKLLVHFNERMFNGYDFDSTMLRIGSMNMLLHGVENPNIRYKDSLSEDHAGDEESYTVILANPPFAGSLDYESTAKDLLQTVKTKKTELLFVALFLRLLKTGGRAAVIVPDGVLFGSSNAHKTIRRALVEEHKLDAIISMPSGVFKPYAGVSTALLVFTKTGAGGTDAVWFYDMQADGFSLDDKRNELDHSKHASDNLPDILARWRNRESEKNRPRTEQSFFVPKAEIAANGYDLGINRYKQVMYEQPQLKALARTVPAGSILVTCIAGSPECIGNAAMTDREVAFNQQINAFVPTNGDAHFLYAQILVGKRLIQSASTAAMKGMVSKGRFEQIRLILPSIELQREFARRVQMVERLKTTNHHSLAKIDALFGSLQQRALTGDLFAEKVAAAVADSTTTAMNQ